MGAAVVILNPIAIINKNWLKDLDASFLICFHYDKVCDIGSYALLVGISLPLTIITYLLILITSDKKDKLKGFAVLLTAYSIAHALHA